MTDALSFGAFALYRVAGSLRSMDPSGPYYPRSWALKPLIVCVSKSHGNTCCVADRMAEMLDAEVVEPESVDVETLGEYDLVGFGSGIYYMSVDAGLRDLIACLPLTTSARSPSSPAVPGRLR